MSGFLTRLIALIRKETRQMLRDRSNLMVGLLLPAALILLFGYGLSFDVRDAPVAVVLEDRSETARDTVAGLSGSPYLAPVAVPDMGRAVALLRAHTVDAIVRVPVDFTARKAGGEGRIQVLLNGYDATSAMTIGTYIDGAIQLSVLHDQDRMGPGMDSGSTLGLVQRVWFNAASISTWYLVPGLLVLVITLIGAFLTSLLIAREWERGTLESLFVTPVRPLELVMAKLAPYMVIGAIDVALCLASARFLFHVPIRGSLGVIIVSSLLYLSVSLMLGLLISGVTRNQFAASQMAMLASFMPATMLSGFVYDIRNMPTAIRAISLMLPATHFMDLIKGLFLAGTVWPLVFKSCGILLLYLVGLGFLTTRTLRKRLD